MNRPPTPLFRTLLAFVVSASIARGESGPAADAALAPLIAHAAAHRDGQAPASFDFAALDGDRSQLPIGVFDSGIGGFTVLEAILGLDSFHNGNLQPGADGVPDFAGERFVYFGDQANMPYGNYPSKGAEPFLHELIVKDAIFLLGRRYHHAGAVRFDKPPVKAIVIACNTATAYGIEDVRAALREWKLDIPVIGVVEAGSRAASATLPSDGDTGAVAVLATVGTCNSGAYPRAIGQAGGMAGKHIPPIIQQGSIGLAGALEGNPAFISTTGRGGSGYLGPSTSNPDALLDPALLAAYGFDMQHMLGDPANPTTWQLNSPDNYARYDVASLVEQYRRRGGGPAIGTVVLGCTHFPIAQEEIASAFARLRDFRDSTGAQPYRALIAGKLTFVNPAEFTARELFRELALRHLRADRTSRQPPQLAGAFVSIPNPNWPGVKLDSTGALDANYKVTRPIGHFEREDVFDAPMAEQPALRQSLSGLAHALPHVWNALTQP